MFVLRMIVLFVLNRISHSARKGPAFSFVLDSHSSVVLTTLCLGKLVCQDVNVMCTFLGCKSSLPNELQPSPPRGPETAASVHFRARGEQSRGGVGGGRRPLVLTSLAASGHVSSLSLSVLMWKWG